MWLYGAYYEILLQYHCNMTKEREETREIEEQESQEVDNGRLPYFVLVHMIFEINL